PADTAAPIKEQPLRRDVRFLGMLLGRVLVEQEGEAFFNTVERLRRLLIQHREQVPDGQARARFDHTLMSEAGDLIAGLSVDDAYRITKAFAIYFELTNLAETNHRKRRRRAARLDPQHRPVNGSFRGTLLRLREAGKSASEIEDALRKIQVTPVFTAHPTEVTRHTVLYKRRRIVNILERLDRLPLAHGEARDLEAQILAELAALSAHLSVSLRRVRASPVLLDRVREYDARLGEEHSRWKRISEAEIYRCFLDYISARLRASRDVTPGPHAYSSAAEFEDDLSLIRESLIANRGQRLAGLLLEPLLRKLR